MASFGLRSITCLLVLAAPACVVRLTERNSPAENGAVSGAPADCSGMPITPRGGTQGADPGLKFVGRFDLRDPNNVRFDWSGNQIVARFEGSQISVRMEAVQSDVLFSAVVDGGAPREIQVYVNKGGIQVPQSYLLFDNLATGPNELVLHRDTEDQSGVTIYHVYDYGGGRLLPPVPNTRRIELICDTITSGYGN
jgi:hypothetical protein